MFKFLILLIVLSFTINTIAQTVVDLGLNKKKDFISIKKLDKNERQIIKDYFITDNDTLVNLKNELTEAELKLFCSCYTNDSLVKKYKKAVFYYEWNDDKLQKSNQWNSDIKVYFAPSIPRNVRTKFIKFYNPLNTINNLKIDFVKNIEDSNYVIKVSNTIIPNLTIRDNKYDETHPLSKISYSMLTDKTRKFYAGTMQIDLDNLDDKSLLLPKLKQVFFLSLGSFIINKSFSETSLVSSQYINSETISIEDFELIKMHYFKIYDQLVSASKIDELVQTSKSICKNE